MNIQGIRVTKLKVSAEKAAAWRKIVRTTAVMLRSQIVPSDEEFQATDKVMLEVCELCRSDLAKAQYNPERGDDIGLHFPMNELESVIVFTIPGGIYTVEELQAIERPQPQKSTVVDLHRGPQ